MRIKCTAITCIHTTILTHPYPVLFILTLLSIYCQYVSRQGKLQVSSSLCPHLEHARIPYGCHFLSWQLSYFPSSSLFVAQESSQERTKALGPCTHVGDPEENRGSWLHFDAALAISVTWGVNHWMKDIFLCLLLSVYLTLQ